MIASSPPLARYGKGQPVTWRSVTCGMAGTDSRTPLLNIVNSLGSKVVSSFDALVNPNHDSLLFSRRHLALLSSRLNAVHTFQSELAAIHHGGEAGHSF
ncbi:hypothetical protein E2C01_059236 [Portunus trituberculatus]|uniref:Uncharacterized protein n=1 Tax=Portunus trituberculatus TaxID=210409 RepID=A0A5B7H7S2_PORTR|nr:hypothetical protein [Portunus trituberculatus]